MKAFAAALTAIFLALVPAGSGLAATPHLAGLTLDLDRLDQASDLTYEVLFPKDLPLDAEEDAALSGPLEPGGTLRLTTSVHADQVDLADEFKAGQGISWNAALTCHKDTVLSPALVVVDMGRGLPMTFDIQGGKVVMTRGEKTMSAPFPPDVLTRSALYRILPLLPKKSGGAWVVASFAQVPEFGPPRKDQALTIFCKGSETHELGGRKLDLTRFEIHGCCRMDAFVDGSRLVLLNDFSGLKLVLTTP